MNKIVSEHQQTFESIRQQGEGGREYWSARDLQSVLGYVKWIRFENLIERAKVSCTQSNQMIEDHFVLLEKIVRLGSGAERSIEDYHLSRYACYLIVQNGDPSKPVIAAGQTYFAIQTRRQELADDEAFKELDEDGKRLFLRNELREHNKHLAKAAKEAGVESPDFGIFQNHGYQGLYGGLGAKDIHQRKRLKKSQHILDHMGSIELAANHFRTTQTEDKLRRENIKGKEKANETHYKVGKRIRNAIQDIGGKMPEDLPTPKTSVKKLTKRDGGTDE